VPPEAEHPLASGIKFCAARPKTWSGIARIAAYAVRATQQCDAVRTPNAPDFQLEMHP
jgi:hypothetical protein